MSGAILNVAEVAALLGCTEESVQIATRTRRLPGVKFGKDWVYSARAIEDVVFREGMSRYEFKEFKPGAGEVPNAVSVTVPVDKRRAANSSRSRPRPALVDVG